MQIVCRDSNRLRRDWMSSVNGMDGTTVPHGLISTWYPLREHCPLMTGGVIRPPTTPRTPSQRIFFWLVRQGTKAQNESALSLCPHAAPNTPPGAFRNGYLEKTEWTRRTSIVKKGHWNEWNLGCLSQVFIAVIKRHNQEQLWKERLFYLTVCNPLSREVQAGTWRQGQMQRHGDVLLTDWYPMACSACFLIAPRTTCPGVTLPHQSSTKKMHHSFSTRPIWSGHFPQMRSPLPWTQVDIKLASMWGKMENIDTISKFPFQ